MRVPRVLSFMATGSFDGKVEGIYDRFAYSDEKADALRRLALLINEIVSGEPSGKVVKMKPKAHANA